MFQLRYGTESDLWNDLASQGANYTDAADPNQANYKYNISIVPPDVQLFTAQEDVTANLIQTDGGWNPLLGQVNTSISGLYSLGAPYQDGNVLVVDVSPKSPAGLVAMAQAGGAGKNHQDLVSVFFTDALANAESASSALTTASQISDEASLAALAAEMTPDNHSQQVAQNIQGTFANQILRRLTAVSNNTGSYSYSGFGDRRGLSDSYDDVSRNGWSFFKSFAISTSFAYKLVRWGERLRKHSR